VFIRRKTKVMGNVDQHNAGLEILRYMKELRPTVHELQIDH
jgi:hypothetical protein